MAVIRKIGIVSNPWCQGGCPIEIPGDVNESGSLTAADIIYMVGYVFKTGPEPLPVPEAGGE